jgi:ankyrin repeat protein
MLTDMHRTPLHLAIMFASAIHLTLDQQASLYECARRLLDDGADVQQQDTNGRSPLHCFFSDMSMDVILRYGEDIDPYMQDKYGMTVLHLAARASRSLRLIMSHAHQKINGLSCLEIKDRCGRSVLHHAVQEGNLDLIISLLASPYATTISMPDSTGVSLLHYAVDSPRVDVIDLLLEANFKIDAVDASGRTILHQVALTGRLDIAHRLIQLGASYQLGCKDHFGLTPLELAQEYSRTLVAEYFLSLKQERNYGDTQKLEMTEIEGNTPPSHSTPHSAPRSMIIVSLLLVVLLQSFLLWWQNNVGVPLTSREQLS